MAVVFDEGIPAPFGICNYNGKQILLLLWEGDSCREIQGQRPVAMVGKQGLVLQQVIGP